MVKPLMFKTIQAGYRVIGSLFENEKFYLLIGSWRVSIILFNSGDLSAVNRIFAPTVDERLNVLIALSCIQKSFDDALLLTSERTFLFSRNHFCTAVEGFKKCSFGEGMRRSSTAVMG